MPGITWLPGERRLALSCLEIEFVVAQPFNTKSKDGLRDRFTLLAEHQRRQRQPYYQQEEILFRLFWFLSQ